MSKDVEDIKLLSIFHYVVGGIGVFFSCMPLIHVGLGIFMITSSESFNNNSNQPPPPIWVGYLFAIIGSIFFLVGQAIAWSIIYSARCLQKKQKYMYSFIVACISCLIMPFGTILGVFTIIVLSRESVKQLYAAS